MLELRGGSSGGAVDGSGGEGLPVGTWIVASGFTASGLVHLVRPKVFESLVPRSLPARRAIVHASGIAELACAAGLLTRQRWAPGASTALLLTIWIGNWTMAVNVQASERVGTPGKVAVWARLPVQVPLIVWAWRSPRTD